MFLDVQACRRWARSWGRGEEYSCLFLQRKLLQPQFFSKAAAFQSALPHHFLFPGPFFLMHAHAYCPLLDLQMKIERKAGGILPANSCDMGVFWSEVRPRAVWSRKQLRAPDPESVHLILMLDVAFLGAQPDPNTITSNKQQLCFNHKSNVYMINAINSNLISLLRAEPRTVPAFWLCTWLCWFFYITSFHLASSQTPG